MRRGVKTYVHTWADNSIMKFVRPIILALALTAVMVITSACSSSSYNERYSKPKEEEHKSNSKGVRFTSDDEPPKKDTNASTASSTEKDNIVVYSDLPNDSSDFDEPPPNDPNAGIDTKKFVENYEKLKSFNVALTPREKVLFEVIKFIDTPYKYGGNTDSGIDCSAFTKDVFETSLSIDLPRTASEQYKSGEKIGSKDDLQFGDLVFFNTTRRSYPGHVGIYLGDNKFVHASRSMGVTVSTLDTPYYKRRYVGARRINSSLDQ